MTALPHHPFSTPQPRRTTVKDVFTASEVGLANRNSGLLLEALALDVTPVGMHYLLTHFDVPLLSAESHELRLEDGFDAPLRLSIADLRALPSVTRPVTLECAGNGRIGMDPRASSMPWKHEAVGTGLWTGTPLAPLLQRARPQDGTVEFAFEGCDFGYDGGVGHVFGRAMTPEQIEATGALLVYEMNGAPLLPQHGAPLRLIVPGWYGMASVKWLSRIAALKQPYDGFQQVRTYRYRQDPEEPGEPVTTMRVRALMIPPGVPDWFSRKRLVKAGAQRLSGRAWSGGGTPIASVEVDTGDGWRPADVTPAQDSHAWSFWEADWLAEPGVHRLRCRATDAAGEVQPLEAPYNLSGFANNAVQCLEVVVE